MIAMVELVGTEHTFEGVDCLLFEISTKKHVKYSSNAINNHKNDIFGYNFQPFIIINN